MYLLRITCNIISLNIENMLFVAFLLSSNKSSSYICGFGLFKNIDIYTIYFTFYDIKSFISKPFKIV